MMKGNACVIHVVAAKARRWTPFRLVFHFPHGGYERASGVAKVLLRQKPLFPNTLLNGLTKPASASFEAEGLVFYSKKYS